VNEVEMDVKPDGDFGNQPVADNPGPTKEPALELSMTLYARDRHSPPMEASCEVNWPVAEFDGQCPVFVQPNQAAVAVA